jgi:hypothetical protein
MQIQRKDAKQLQTDYDVVDKELADFFRKKNKGTIEAE